MAFGSFSEGSHAQPMGEINTTPLVDVMLVLLVIFIITAPLFQQAVAIDLPKVDSTRLEERPRVVPLALDGEGRIHLDAQPVARAELDRLLQDAVTPGRPAPELHLRADRGTRYERVADVMAAAQKAGIAKIAFVTEPPG